MSDNFKARVHVDSKSFRTKPAGYEAGRIKHAFLDAATIKSLDLFELIDLIQTGHTVEPGLCPYPDQNAIPSKGGTREEYYLGQNVFMVDIDNDINALPADVIDDFPPFETPETYKKKLEEHQIYPAFFYYSFSSGSPLRFRAVIFSDEMTRSKEEARSILAGLIALSPYADRSCVNVDKIFYGTNKEKGIVKGLTDRGAVNPLNALLEFANEMKDELDIFTQLEEESEKEDSGIITEGGAIAGANSEAFREVERKIANGESFQILEGNRGNFISAYAFDRWKRYGPKGKEYVKEDVIDVAAYCVPPVAFSYVYKKIDQAEEAAHRKIFNRPDYTPPILPEEALEEFEPLGEEAEQKESANGPNNDTQGQLTQSNNNIPPEQEKGENQAKKPEKNEDQTIKPKARDNRMERLKALAVSNVAKAIPNFSKAIQDKEGVMAHTVTGFDDLDKLLQGGIYPGFHVLGGDTGCGKTTLALQIADYIAANGRDVLYFSLEMDRNELIARSISRMCYERAGSPEEDDDDSPFENLDNPYSDLLLDANAILTPEVKDEWEEHTTNGVLETIGAYSETIGQRLQYICEIGTLNTDDMEKLVDHHISYYQDDQGNIPPDRYPVVFVDYLQILAPNPGEEKLSDKQRIDRAVLQLKRLSKRHNIPVIAISSFNRNSYYEPVELTSFKESGAIEYTADSIWGLQLDGLDYEQFDPFRSFRILKLRALAETRKKKGYYLWLKFKVLKNRRGFTDDFAIDYNARYNTFKAGDYHKRDALRQIAQELRDNKKQEKEADKESAAKKQEKSEDFFKKWSR